MRRTQLQLGLAHYKRRNHSDCRSWIAGMRCNKVVCWSFGLAELNVRMLLQFVGMNGDAVSTCCGGTGVDVIQVGIHAFAGL